MSSDTDMVVIPRAWLAAYLDDSQSKVEVSGEPTSLWDVFRTIADHPQAEFQSGATPWKKDDLMLVPRGLLGAARYAMKSKKRVPVIFRELGRYCYSDKAPQLTPILWVTIYRKAGEADRVESGPIDVTRDGLASTRGWSVLHTELYCLAQTPSMPRLSK